VRDYVSVDGGMGDNPRPALYQATYEACLVNRANEPEGGLFTIAGKCCESGDILIWDVPMPRPRPGDILAVSCTGAYNYTMSMNYNRLPRPAMVLVSGGQAEVIVERETYADLVARERVPERLAAPRPRVVQKTRRS
jgi:diaminopimelate decarboxylase